MNNNIAPRQEYLASIVVRVCVASRYSVYLCDVSLIIDIIFINEFEHNTYFSRSKTLVFVSLLLRNNPRFTITTYYYADYTSIIILVMHQLCLRTQTMPFCIWCRRRKEHTQVQVQKKKERKEHIQQVQKKKERKEHTQQVKKKERKEHTQVQKKEKKIMKMKVVELDNNSSLSPKQQQKKKHKPVNFTSYNSNININNNNNKSSYLSSSAAKERIEKESKRIQEKSLRNRQAKIQSLLLAGVGDGITGVSSRKKSLNESYDRWNKQGTSFIVDNSNKNLKAKNSTTTVITSPTTMRKKKKMKLKTENLAVMTTTINERQFEVGDRVMKKVKNKITDQIITHGPYIIINYLASIDGDHTEDKVIIQNNKSFTPVYETISVTKVVPYKEY